jgi:hypothetical protein
LEELAQREFERNEILPWEHLSGPGKKYLLGHLDEAMEDARFSMLDARNCQQD